MNKLLKSFEYDSDILKRNAAIIFKMYTEFIKKNLKIPTVENIEDMIVQYNMGAISEELKTTDSDKILSVYERLSMSESAFTLMNEFIIRIFCQSKVAIIDSTFDLIDSGVLPLTDETENGKVVYNDAQNILLPGFVRNGVLSQGLNFNVIRIQEKLALGGEIV